MKRVLALLLSLVMILALGACKPGDGDSQPTTGSHEIDWQGIPDPDIVGAWEPVEGVKDEYVLFTPESKLRVVNGTVVFEANVNFGADSLGNKSAYTEGNYLYGQWVYAIEDDTLTITYPDGKAEVFKKADYTPITLETKKDFSAKAAKDLVGTWTNDVYGDSYKFTEDGYAIFTLEYDDSVYVYDTEIKYTYTVKDGEITLYCFRDNSGEEIAETFEYSIDGTKLLIDGQDYYLNGEGTPTAPSTEPVVVE